MWTRAHLVFWCIQLGKNIQLSLCGPYVKAVYEFYENAHKFQKISYGGIIPFVYVGRDKT